VRFLKGTGVWHYAGEPVEIILLIRVEDERLDIGDYVGDQLEQIGFVTVGDYKTAAEASPIWISGNPSDGLFHVYTGGWTTPTMPRDLAGNFEFFYTPRGFDVPLWQAYTPAPEFDEVAERLATRDFATIEERRELMAQALEMAFEDSVRVWISDRASVTPRRAEVSYASDFYGSISGSWLWPYTLQRDGNPSTPLNIGSPSVLTASWNPLDGTNWIYDMMFIRAIGENATIIDPYTGLARPQRIEGADVIVKEGLPIRKTLDWVNLDFASQIQVPADA
jgi:peptide/nickel transport system substrate-binding protein